MSDPINITATVNASAGKVWDYYTNPKHITCWNFADPSWHCPHVSNDMRVGGRYYARMEAKDGSFGFDFEAVYTDIVPGEQFTYTLADGRRVSVVFKKQDNQTKVDVTFDPENQNPLDMQRTGWQAILDNFKRYTETA